MTQPPSALPKMQSQLPRAADYARRESTTEAGSEAAWSYLYINVNVVGPAYGISVQYLKYVNDLATMLERAATTWDSGSTGTHGRNPTYISSNVAGHIDEFIDEYLRVNEDACH